MLSKREAELPEEVENALLVQAGNVGRTLVWYAECYAEVKDYVPAKVYIEESRILWGLREAYRWGYDGEYDLDYRMRQKATDIGQEMADNSDINITTFDDEEVTGLPVDSIAIYGGLLGAYEKGRRDAETTVKVNEDAACTTPS